MTQIYIQIRADEELKRKLAEICKAHERDFSKEIRNLINREYQIVFPRGEKKEESRIAVVES